MRGQSSPSAASDLDLYVIHEAAYQQRLQYFFSGVPAEIFVNPEIQAHTYLDSEQTDGRPRKTCISRPRYLIGSLYEDATDVVDHVPDTARLLANRVVWEALAPSFQFRGLFVPRLKDILARLREIDSDLHALVVAFLHEPDARRAVGIAGEIAERVAGVRGFFEWESSPKPIEGALPAVLPDNET